MRQAFVIKVSVLNHLLMSKYSRARKHDYDLLWAKFRALASHAGIFGYLV
jgi:hypothetical protein